MELHELSNLEMAKKRNHKIPITDKAIEKVPFIKYREIPTEEYEIIHNLAKQVLQLSKDKNDSNEVAITYSFDKFNYPKAVSLLNQAIQQYNASCNLKGYQNAAKHFISNCYTTGIIYKDR